MILPKFNNQKYQKYLYRLPKISQSADDIKFFYTPDRFLEIFLEKIYRATCRVCIVTLYLEQDECGYTILNALYETKRQRPEVDMRVFVDWHRAQRGRIGVKISSTNANWYCYIAQKNSGIEIPVFGVPINTREALGVLHFKGFIIDDSVLYSGVSISDAYFHQINKYRCDRYHLIRNSRMSDIIFNWIDQNLTHGQGVYRLNDWQCPKKFKIKNEVRLFRQKLRDTTYHFHGDADNKELSVVPLVGLGRSSLLNKTIFHLMKCVDKKITICTPYFNLPTILVRNIVRLLRSGKQVEIIVGDKTANDFFVSEDQPFKIISMVPYLYEINLRRFLTKFQSYIDADKLTVGLWKDRDNGYHLKGMWADKEWILLTGNNLNPRAWHLDLENAILIHDPQHELSSCRNHELNLIRAHTTLIRHYCDLQDISDYPIRVRKLVRYLLHTRLNWLINKIL